MGFSHPPSSIRSLPPPFASPTPPSPPKLCLSQQLGLQIRRDRERNRVGEICRWERERDEAIDKGIDWGLRHGNNDRADTYNIYCSHTVLCPPLLTCVYCRWKSSVGRYPNVMRIQGSHPTIWSKYYIINLKILQERGNLGDAGDVGMIILK